MISTQTLLFLVLTVCLLTLTVVVAILGVQLIQVLQEIKLIAHNIEELTTLVERVAQVVFPGMEKVAKRADRFTEKVGDFISKKVDKLTKE